MKKLIVRCIAALSLIASVSTVHAQDITAKTAKLTNTEIANLVNSACKKAGITDPDHIMVGDKVVVQRSSGRFETIIAWPGATRWGMTDSLGKMQGDDPIVNVNVDDTTGHEEMSDHDADSIAWQKAVKDGKIPLPNLHTDEYVADTFIGLVILLVLLFLWFKFGRPAYLKKQAELKEAESKKREAEAAERRRQNDPAEAGPAMYPGGVNEHNAHAIALENAHRNNPMHNIEVLRVERCTLDSHGIEKQVGYADYPRMMVLRNTPGIRATVRIDGNEKTVYQYSVMFCGNNIPGGGGLNDDGSITCTLTPNAQPLYVAPVVPVKTEANDEVENVNEASQIPVVISKVPGLIDKAIKSGSTFKLNLVVENGKQELEMNIYAPATKKA
jgi:hypothetical protein